VIDTATNTISTTIPGFFQGTGIAITPDGASAYATVGFPAAVAVIDTVSNTMTATIPLGAFPRRVAITPDGASPT
jgi:YVTN family beta-propeller protein